MEANIRILIVMIIYLFFLISWGIYQGRKVKNAVDYAIAGRRLPGWAAALSERATGESSWALLGLPGLAYATGLTSIWTAIGCVAGIITAWWAIAWRLRNEAEKHGVTSFTDYISKKHGEVGRLLRVTASLTIVFFFFFYVGAQFLGGGKTLNTLFNIKPAYGMLITALIILPYTVYGGFQSVIYTDVVQALVMIFTLIAGPIVGFIYIANHPDVFAATVNEALSRAGGSYTSITGAGSGFAAGVTIMGGFSWFFGYLGGQPQLSMRFMAINDPKQARLGRNIGIGWTILAYIGALCIGWIGLAIFGPGTLTDQEVVMPTVMLRIFPPVIAAIMITGAIAAMISTADSLLILSANELSDNLLNRPDEKISARARLRRSRLITAILAVIALGAAYISPSDLIYTIVGYVWAGIGCPFSVVILLTLFWKRYHGRAAIITIITGLVFTIIWASTDLEKEISARVTSFLASAIAAVLSTYLIPPKPLTSNT
jgi:sodium/proline symporter